MNPSIDPRDVVTALRNRIQARDRATARAVVADDLGLQSPANFFGGEEIKPTHYWGQLSGETAPERSPDRVAP